MTCCPQYHHAFQQSRAWTAHALEQVHICARDEAWRIVGQDDAILHRRVLEETHFSPNVIDGGDEEVESAVHRVELRVGNARQTKLANQRADELDVGASVVAVLVHPLL